MSQQNPDGKLEVRKTNAAIYPVCLRDRHLPNAPVNISGWKLGARQLAKKTRQDTGVLFLTGPRSAAVHGAARPRRRPVRVLLLATVVLLLPHGHPGATAKHGHRSYEGEEQGM